MKGSTVWVSPSSSQRWPWFERIWCSGCLLVVNVCLDIGIHS